MVSRRSIHSADVLNISAIGRLLVLAKNKA
jgi:hypothetical protein